MEDAKCKTCRRVGEKLFLKGERCFSAKCAFTRKPYPPGIHGRSARRGSSEFAVQLREKQKLRKLYGVAERPFENYVKAATAGKGDAGGNLLAGLEMRLDNAVFQSGLAQSRSIARQMVSHGHVLVNQRKVRIASYALRIGDVISLSKRAIQSKAVTDFEPIFAKYNAPEWLLVDKTKHEARVAIMPQITDGAQLHGTKLIIEYYAR